MYVENLKKQDTWNATGTTVRGELLYVRWCVFNINNELNKLYSCIYIVLNNNKNEWNYYKKKNNKSYRISGNFRWFKIYHVSEN